ncbi:DUF6167 family protein [Streptacidiphilus cavernicola]|uniref:DUF6167 family protein n=1 Tax=Streptacidiphilus cavernicola TaxID=3342716 RepID=A0ABV6VQX9_9ACTN
MFWMAVGAGATVWTLNKAQRLARSITPGSLADSAARGAVEAGSAVRSFTGEVRAGMLQRELQLNRELGLDGSVLARTEPSKAPVLRGGVKKRVEIPPAVPSTTHITPYNRNEDL